MENEIKSREIKIMELLKKEPLCLEELAKNFHLAYNYLYREVTRLKKRDFILELEDQNDKRRKLLALTNEGKIFLGKLETRKSAVAKIDSWLDKKFNEIGIDCERLFK